MTEPRYRLEGIPVYAGSESTVVWFLDEVVVEDGKAVARNVCSGTREECEKKMAELKGGEK